MVETHKRKRKNTVITKITFTISGSFDTQKQQKLLHQFFVLCYHQHPHHDHIYIAPERNTQALKKESTKRHEAGIKQVSIDVAPLKCMPPPHKCIGLAMTLTFDL